MTSRRLLATATEPQLPIWCTLVTTVQELTRVLPTSSIYLRGSRSMRAHHADSDVDLVMVLPRTTIGQSSDWIGTQVAAALLATHVNDVVMSVPQIACWQDIRSYYAADPIEYGTAFWRYAQLLAGREYRRGSLLPPGYDMRQASRDSFVKCLVTLSYKVASHLRTTAAPPVPWRIFGKALRALWLLHSGEFLASYELLLVLTSRHYGGALAELCCANLPASSGHVVIADTDLWTRVLDQLFALWRCVAAEACVCEGIPSINDCTVVRLPLDKPAPFSAKLLVYPDAMSYALALHNARPNSHTFVPIPVSAAHGLMQLARSAAHQSRLLRLVCVQEVNKSAEIVLARTRLELQRQTTAVADYLMRIIAACHVLDVDVAPVERLMRFSAPTCESDTRRRGRLLATWVEAAAWVRSVVVALRSPG